LKSQKKGSAQMSSSSESPSSSDSDQLAYEVESERWQFEIIGLWQRGTTDPPLERRIVRSWGVISLRTITHKVANVPSMLRLTASRGQLELEFKCKVPQSTVPTRLVSNVLSYCYLRALKDSSTPEGTDSGAPTS
jgi:hypothetical protein